MGLIVTMGWGQQNAEDHSGQQTLVAHGAGNCDRLYAHHGVKQVLRIRPGRGVLGPLDDQRWGPGGEPRVPRSG